MNAEIYPPRLLANACHNVAIPAARWLFTALLAYCALVVAAWADVVSYYPEQVVWQCIPAPGGGTGCSLAVIGPLPAGETPTKLYAWVRVRRGPTYGVGVELANPLIEMTCSNAISVLYCTRPDVVVLGPGIEYVAGYDLRPDLNIYLPGAPPSPAFDWDGDGAITAQREGVMLIRYLLGLSAAAVSGGIPLTGARTPASVYEEIKTVAERGWFRFADAVDTTAHRDGMMFVRCLRGLSGTQLVAGVPSADPAKANKICAGLLATQ